LLNTAKFLDKKTENVGLTKTSGKSLDNPEIPGLDFPETSVVSVTAAVSPDKI
jgi:hypothetical protein